MKTLVVGVGNPARRDDGVGWAVAERVAALDLPGVEVRNLQQLQVELAEDFAGFDRVVVVDASVGGDPVRLRTVHPGPARGASRGSGVAERRQTTASQSAALGRAAATPDTAGPQRLGDTSPAARESTASHHLSPALLLALTDRLHGRTPELLLCTVRGEEFGFGDSLSPAVEARAAEAERRILDSIGQSRSGQTT